MPNHVTNLLSCTTADTGKMLKPYMTDDGKNIDFNKIVPMPQGILETCNHDTIQNITAEKTEKQKQIEQENHDMLLEINKKEYGYSSWYDWSVANWDTKWNAYSCWTLEEGDLQLEDISDLGFQTAWSPPIAVIKELAIKTGQTWRMSYYDEGWMFGGELFAYPDGSIEDNCYDDPKDCPEHLHEELDVQYYLDCMSEDEEEHDDE